MIKPTVQQIEFDYLITPDGLEYNFHDPNSPLTDGRWLLTFEGQGMPDISYITQRGPFQHGITVLDYRLNPRTITYLHSRSACDRLGYWATRADLINHCRPNRQVPNTPYKLATLRKILPDDSKWDIDVVIQSGPYGNARTLTQWKETRWTETLKFLAPDPAFYNTDMVILPLGIAICEDLVFPFDFPFIFCGDVLSVVNSVTYTGTWLSNPIIIFTGPFSAGAFVQNVTTGELIQFTRDIPAGIVITIDTRYGKKTVTDQLGNSWIGALSTNSDLATFHLAPDPEAPGGVNTISAGGTGGVSGLSKVELRWYTRYIGI